jgi:uncharacterized integral membrane protein
MRLAKIFIGLLIVLLLAVFLASNSDQYATIWLLPGKTLEDINLAHILVSTLALGIILGFGIGLLQIVSQQREVRSQSRQLKKLRTELNNLRHSALNEEIFDTELPAPTEPESETEPEKE